MIQALLLSIRQLSDPKIATVLVKTILISLALFALFGIAAFFGLVWLFEWLGWHEGGFWAATAAVLVALLTAILLFRVIAIFVLNIFSDDIVDAVERLHYPDRAETAKPPGYVHGAKMGLASVGRTIGYNLLALPVYVVLLVTGVGAPLVFFAVNAILLGRDLQDMVASRHVEQLSQIEERWRIPKLDRFLLGLLSALLLAVPFINFLAPVVAAAMATHLVHGRTSEGQKA